MYTCTYSLVPDELYNELMKSLYGVKDNSSNVVHFDDIKQVIFNDPATIIIFNDGSKSVVKCCEGDQYDKEVGFQLAYFKHLYEGMEGFKAAVHKAVKNGTDVQELKRKKACEAARGKNQNRENHIRKCYRYICED